MDTIEYGHCHCGCGQRTALAKYDDKRYGYIKGKPRRFIQHHQVRPGKDHPNWKGGRCIQKCRNTSYVRIYTPEHPMANNGYVFEHILVVEADWGYPLPNGSVVHHIDGNGLNNEISNLMVFGNNADHLRFHAMLRASDKSEYTGR